MFEVENIIERIRGNFVFQIVGKYFEIYSLPPIGNKIMKFLEV